LLAHDWPGNVRELRNAIERAMILEDSSQITPASLPASVGRATASAAAAAAAPSAFVPPPAPDLGLSLEENERQLILRALEKTNGNQTQAAKLLKITRDTLRYKMKKFKLR
jgi:two-component system response regulator AtoC